MRKETIADLPLNPTPLGGSARQLIERPDLRLVNLLVKAGEEVKAHTAPVEVVFVVLAGKGSVYAEDDRVEIEGGQFLVCPAGVSRTVIADPETDLSLLVIRSPNPLAG